MLFLLWSLDPPLVKKKSSKYDWWYGYATSKTVVQSIGRSVRNEKDVAVTYILDSAWDWFYSKNLPTNLDIKHYSRIMQILKY